MENFEKTANKYCEVLGELRKDCVEYLKRKLQENGNHIDWEDKDLDCSVCLSYDGGNHPEYASNCYSTLTAIDLNDGVEITFDIEDDGCYYIDNVPTSELYDVCDFLENVYFPCLSEENK